MIKIHFVVWYSVAADCEIHDSISDRLMQCHANGCVHVAVARQRLCTVNVRNCCVVYEVTVQWPFKLW